MSNTWLDDLELSTRARRLIEQMGISSRAELTELTEEAFLIQRGAGRKTWSEIDEARIPPTIDGIRLTRERPAGYRICSAPIRLTEKAVMVGYHGHKLWLPKRSVVLWGGKIVAPESAIDRAKAYNDQNGT